MAAAKHRRKIGGEAGEANAHSCDCVEKYGQGGREETREGGLKKRVRERQGKALPCKKLRIQTTVRRGWHVVIPYPS